MKKTLHLIIPVLLVLFSFSLKATTHVVIATSSYIFDSMHVNAVVGDTIRWEWKGGPPHTTTSVTIPVSAQPWDTLLDSTHPAFSYVLEAVGDYAYKSTIDDTIFSGNGMPGTITVTSGATGISKVSITASLNFYPNPVRNNLNVTFSNVPDGSGWIKIYDLTGKVIQTTQVSVAAGVNTLTLPMGNLDNGVYMAELFVGDKRVGVKKISKN